MSGTREELNLALAVIVSVAASPKMVLFSTVKVETLVAPTLTDPSVVKLPAKTSPSASTMNFGAPLTARPKRLESATAVAGLIYREESETLEFAASIAQTPNA